MFLCNYFCLVNTFLFHLAISSFSLHQRHCLDYCSLSVSFKLICIHFPTLLFFLLFGFKCTAFIYEVLVCEFLQKSNFNWVLFNMQFILGKAILTIVSLWLMFLMFHLFMFLEISLRNILYVLLIKSGAYFAKVIPLKISL